MNRKEQETMHWNGANQGERMLKALNPEFIKVDERSLSDFLAFASQYSRLIRYFDENNTQDGDWTKFFQNDLSIYIASIISTDLGRIERAHSAYISALEVAHSSEDRLSALNGLLTQVISMGKLINDWYFHSLQMNKLQPGVADELENEMENAIKQQLASALKDILSYCNILGFHKNDQFSPAEIENQFHGIWFSGIGLLTENNSESSLKVTAELIRDYTKKARIKFRIFYSVISYVIQIAPKQLEKSLTEKDDHRPDMALFIAFVQLFKHNQDQLNTITSKHLDFYYYDVLKFKERTFTPDKVNLYLRIAQHIDKYALPEGTLFYGGIGSDGQPIHYASDYSVELNKAQISSLKTIFVSKNPKIGIGSSYKLITNVYSAPVANSRNGLGERFINNEEEWPGFGEELLEKPETERQMTYAEIGWAVAAPILEMEEGHRIVTLKMEFEKASMYTLNLLIKDISKNQNITKDDAFSKIFKNSLNVFFTGPEGWIKANSCEVIPPLDWTDPEITIVVSLTTAAPPVIGLNPDIHVEGFDTRLPMIKVLHQNTDVIYTYSFLKDLLLERVTIDVNVQDIKKLQLFNEYGILESSIPFQPFGAVPKPGSYLLVGKAELFKKELTDLQINLEWHNLPENKKGLRGYYKEYELGISNESHKIRVSALTEGSFFPAKEDNLREFRLFHDDQEDKNQIAATTALDSFDLKAFNIKPVPQLVLPTIFTNEIKSGYFKLELTSPAFGFAHEEYPGIYTKIITQNTDPKRKGPELSLPKQPWTPFVRTISLDYSATTQINVLSIGTIKGKSENEQLFHIHPFGVLKTFYDGRPVNRAILPAFDEDAYLFIGLTDLNPPSSLSIYFELKENQDYYSMLKGKSAESRQAEVVWSYLSNDEWKEFSQNQILNDTTFAFNNSGIITIDLPRDLTSDNNILPKNQYWLRVALKGDATRMPRVLRIATQALSATWVDNGNGNNHLQKALPENSINALVVGVPELREVFQPFKSFGGRPAEQKNEFYTRVSERLRHKGRAVAAWDYERLVLERFPNLFQVKCVIHVGNEKFVKKGSVIIVVVPKVGNGSNRLPMVNNSTLDSIRNYLKPLASPFVSIEVRNPIYERIKISAAIQFENGKNNGTYLKKLNQDIIEFMCPWLFGNEKELELGGQIAKDVILSFIEKRSYVEFVTKFSVVQVFPTEIGFDVDDSAIDNSSSPIIEATSPWSVLIPFSNNPLYLVDDLSFQSPEKAGIDTMMLDGDFVMTEEREF